jgi:ABC-type cobalamin/Fe3+-siderophores transport system ATPase subunit
MTMYTRLSVQRFRGLRNVAIDHLAPINILIGNNGTGKTTFLEALWLHSSPNGELVARVDAFRAFTWEPSAPGISPTGSPWRYLFYGNSVHERVVLSGQANGHRWTFSLRQVSDKKSAIPIKVNPPTIPGGQVVSGNFLTAVLNPLNVTRSVQLVLEFTDEDTPAPKPSVIATLDSTSQGVVLMQHDQQAMRAPAIVATLLSSPLRYSADVAVRYGAIDRENRQDRVLQIARIVEPRLKRLSVVPRANGEPYLYADVGQRELIPVQLMGGGFQSLVSYAVAAVGTAGGVVLVDQIENGVHYSALERLWQGLSALCHDTDTQIVATTHSFECVDAARRVLPADRFLVHRFSRQDLAGDVMVQTLDAEMLESAHAMGLEVR